MKIDVSAAFLERLIVYAEKAEAWKDVKTLKAKHRVVKRAQTATAQILTFPPRSTWGKNQMPE